MFVVCLHTLEVLLINVGLPFDCCTFEELYETWSRQHSYVHWHLSLHHQQIVLWEGYVRAPVPGEEAQVFGLLCCIFSVHSVQIIEMVDQNYIQTWVQYNGQEEMWSNFSQDIWSCTLTLIGEQVPENLGDLVKRLPPASYEVHALAKDIPASPTKQ